MNYIAHIRESDQKHQTVEEHLLGVMKLAESYGESIGVAHIAGLAGMLHDLGKYTEAFRSYILEAVSNPEAPPKRGSVDHSTAGGRLLYNLFHTGKINHSKGILAEIVGNAIISHHSYLHDFLNPELESNYLQRVRDKQCRELDEIGHTMQCFFERVMSEQKFHEYVDQAVVELESYRSKSTSLNSEAKLMFLTKFVFSCLIDADRTDTRRFEDKIDPDDERTNSKILINQFYDRLMKHIESLTGNADTVSPINALRAQMSKQCDSFANQTSGIFTLSIPTGGGKTLASLRYALKHASIYEKKRIIYVLPYTTIIEQNAAEVRRILQDDVHILEHHSNVIEDAGEDDELMDGRIDRRQKLKLAKDNWDSPIIFTTMVQFLNVFFANGSRNIRRLHHLSESVIIFDEVQKVPVSCVSLFNEALNFLNTYCKSSIVLCTATQPALDFVEHKLSISPSAEMISELDQVIAAFKRVDVVDRATGEQFNNLSLSKFIEEQMKEVQSVLVILNTKSVVKKLYQQLLLHSSDSLIFHLSTSMCAAHRKEILEKIRGHLKNGERIICVSTPLIEAGVDVSFECVIRSLAGLDSIAQAAGRCNRHGEYGIRQVHVIDHVEENLKNLQEVMRGKEISRKILIDLRQDPTSHGGHILSVSAMKRYFQEFYTAFKSDLDYFVPKLDGELTSLLFASLSENKYFGDYLTNKKERLPLFLANSYKTAAVHFRVIDDMATPVIVPYGDEGKAIIAELNGAERIEDFTRLLRSAQQYTVNLFDYELRLVDQNGGLEHCMDGEMFVLSESAYNYEYGVDTDNDSTMSLNIF